MACWEPISSASRLVSMVPCAIYIPYRFCRPIHTRDILHQLVSEFVDMKQLRAGSMSMAGSPSSVIVPSGSMRSGSPRICKSDFLRC
jgi:hypothetical protein